ncbi:MAG: hypothetical protein KDD62_06650 [Bdellovibrionales bacterium]|nr:hypothetical protein [Bdellovibrionales bacterium]
MQASSSYLSLDLVTAIARILFGLLFLAKMYHSLQARKLVWGHRQPFGHRGLRWFSAVLVLSIVCFILGIGTGPAALSMWILYLFLYRYASLFGLEDVCFTTTAAYFALAVPNQRLAFDTIFLLPGWGRLFSTESLVPELALTTVVGLIFLSAGLEKLPSQIWKRGLGAYYFFWQPQFRRFDTSWLIQYSFVIIPVGWIALIMELGILPVWSFNVLPFGLLFWVLGFGFVLSLWTIFILTWIGECLTIGMLVILWVFLEKQAGGLVSWWTEALSYPMGFPQILVLIALLVSIGAVTLTVCIPIGFIRFMKLPMLSRIYKMSRILSRFTWGIIPVDVFTEAHMEGPMIYRTFVHFKNGSESQEVFRIFSENCSPGPERPFRPAFFEVTSYKVTEVCMELDAHSAVSPERQSFMFELCDYIIDSRLDDFQRNEISHFSFQTVQIIPPKGFRGIAAAYLEEAWEEAFRVLFREGTPSAIEASREKIVKAPTGRDISRLSFAFNPLSK